MLKKHRPIAVLTAVCVLLYGYTIGILYYIYYGYYRSAVINEVIEGDYLYTESIATNGDGEVVYKKTPKF